MRTVWNPPRPRGYVPGSRSASARRFPGAGCQQGTRPEEPALALRRWGSGRAGLASSLMLGRAACDTGVGTTGRPWPGGLQARQPPACRLLGTVPVTVISAQQGVGGRAPEPTEDRGFWNAPAGARSQHGGAGGAGGAWGVLSAVSPRGPGGSEPGSVLLWAHADSHPSPPTPAPTRAVLLGLGRPLFAASLRLVSPLWRKRATR